MWIYFSVPFIYLLMLWDELAMLASQWHGFPVDVEKYWENHVNRQIAALYSIKLRDVSSITYFINAAST